MPVELIENQRWYPILGWSARLYEDDPPPWCTPQQEKRPSKDEQPDVEWTVYRSDDYDEEGWLYSTKFSDEWGSKKRSSMVRTRVWMGRLPGEEPLPNITTAAAATAPLPLKDTTEATASNEEWKNLFSSAKDSSKNAEQQNGREAEKNSVLFPTIASGESAETLFPSATAEEKVSLPPLSSQAGKTPAATEEKRSGGFFGKLSAAALSLPSSVITLAGESSMQAVYGTAQSIKEVSLYGLEKAQAVTTAAITAEPVLPPHRKAQSKSTSDTDGSDPYQVLSMLSKRFPDLSPVDRSLVTCCDSDPSAHLSPPEPIIAKECKVCHQEFGLTKFRYQCGYCSESFCHSDLSHSEILRAFGHSVPSKICANCRLILMQKIDQQFTQWRNERVKDFLEDKLILYFNTASDTAVDKIMRAAEGTLAAAKSVPIGATAKMAVVSADFLRKYGRAGLLGFILRNEFMQSFATLKGLIGDLDGLGFQDAAIGTFYFMAMNRGERGAHPEAEKENHSGCTPISDEFLADVLKYAPLALHGIYELDVLDIQRISKLQNFSLIYAHVQNHDVRHPSYALLGNKENKTALVLIRGSKSVQDLLTDIQAHPEEIGLSPEDATQEEATGGFVDAFAHNGMLKAAMWIKDRIIGSLRILHNEGYRIVFAGHSLGAGCAALLSVMLQKEFEDLQCFAYAVPACVNLHVAESCVNFVHSIVLRDDFVPRAKASNILKLIKELEDFKGCWRDTASEDIEAFKERAKSLWAPRKREWAREEADKLKGKLPKRVQPSHQVKPLGASKDNNLVSTGPQDDKPKEEEPVSWTLTRTNLIEQMDKADLTEERLVSTEVKQEEEKVFKELVTTLVEDPKELYIPGKVTHIYFYKGIYEAVYVDRKCDALAHIPMQQNMLSDHLGRNYLSALRIVRDARRMKLNLPEWVPFSTKTRCMCCDAPFTWNSTSSSEAQQNRDQHNCRRCGWLVCEGCSEKWKSIPEFGINVPVRVCDRCTYEL